MIGASRSRVGASTIIECGFGVSLVNSRTAAAVVQQHTLLISTEEDLRFRRARSGGATPACWCSRYRAVEIMLAGPGNLTVFYPRTLMSVWAKTECEADIINETGGTAARILAPRWPAWKSYALTGGTQRA